MFDKDDSIDLKCLLDSLDGIKNRVRDDIRKEKR